MTDDGRAKAYLDLGRAAPAYLLAHFGKSLMWHGGNLFFAFYLTEMCGQSAGAMAGLVAVSSLLNALADGLVGVRLSGSMTSADVARRQQLTGAILAGGTFALFCTTALLPAEMRLGMAGGALLAFRIVYAWLDVPQNALLAFLPANPAQQERLVAARMMVGHLAQCVTALLLGALLLHRSSASPTWVAIAGAAIAAVAIGTALILRVTGISAPAPQALPPRDNAADTGGARSYPRLLLLCAAFGFASGLVIRLQGYLAAYGLGARASAVGSLVPITIAAGAMVAQPGWAWLSARQGIESTLRIAGMTLAMAAMLFGISPWVSEAAVPVAATLFGAAMGGTGFALWAMLSSHARRGNAAGRFGLFTSVSKLAQALSALALGGVLAAGDYRAATGVTHLWAAAPAAALLLAALLLVLVARPRVRTGSCS
jgi:Na+/melibiose symporter-like transporter